MLHFFCVTFLVMFAIHSRFLLTIMYDFLQLVDCCKNHPLTLSVVGGLLKGKNKANWLGMLKNLSEKKQSVFNMNEPKLLSLERSLNVFEEESVIKQCYLDLGLFPEDQKIAATMLMDMWVHLYKHDEEGLDTINQLFELSYKNLATLLPIRYLASDQSQQNVKI